MVEKADLGLSLSLSFPTEQQHQQQHVTGIHLHQHNHNHININNHHHHSLQLNLMPTAANSSSSSPSPFNHLLHKSSSPWCSTTDHSSFPSSSDRNQDMFRVETRSFLKGIDVNRMPATVVDAEEEAGVSSPNSTISSVSGKRSVSERDAAGDDLDNERASSGGLSDGEDGDNSRKKLRLSKDQSAVLEESFKEHNTLNPKQKLALAKRLGLRPRQVEVWFQNRRARTKLKQTEVDCEFLKRCCENLTEENRRLQKEVQELRALKLSPQFYMQMTPPTTLTMCPSCERVGVPPPSTTSGAPAAAAAKPADHPRLHPMAPSPLRAIPFNPWANAPPVQQHRPFDVMQHPRS